MKKSFIFVILFALALSTAALLFTNRTASAADPSSPCPDWEGKIPGLCLTHQDQLQVENVPVLDDVRDIKIDTQWQPDRWLIQVRNNVPASAYLPLGPSTNKYKIEIVSVFVDQRITMDPPDHEGYFYDTVYVLVRLTCDVNGSNSPTTSVSMPRQEITLSDGTVYHRIPRNLYMKTINWIDSIDQTCQY